MILKSRVQWTSGEKIATLLISDNMGCPTVYRDIGDVSKPCHHPGDRLARQNGIPRGQASSTGMPPNQTVNKVEELTHLSINIELLQMTPIYY